VFPAIDELGHRFGPLCDESYEAYRRFDVCIGRLVDDLARRGRADDTLIALTSDHGQTATHTHLDIDDLVRAVYPRTVAYPRLWRYGWSAEAAAMVSGNGMANVYVQGARGWSERPDFDEAGARAAALRDRLLAHPGIEHVIYRRAHAAGTGDGDDVGDDFVVAGPGGKLVVHVEPAEEDPDRLADPWLDVSVEGADPVGYAAVPRRMRKSEAAALTAATRFPDLPGQLVDFFRAGRAGDLIVCARIGFDLRSRFEYQPHRGSHGCLDREHILVPAAFNASLGDASVRAVDLFPTILAAMGAPPAPGRLGRALALESVT
jgi:arylsulfatase A-like enzyme